MAEKLGSSGHNEAAADAAAAAPRRSFGQKFARHCTRFWWLHLIIFIIVVLVVVLPVIYVGYPKIAQDGINSATLQITSQEVLNPTPDHVDVSLTSRFITDSSYHPDLKAFNASLYLEGRDKPFINLGIPDIDGAKNGTVVQVDEEAAVIGNRDEFERYCQTTLGSAEYTVFLTGSGGLKQGGLPNTNVDYNNSVTIKGLNQLKGLTVTNFSLLSNTLESGANSRGQVMIPNPSVLTLALGDVYVEMYVNDTFIANATMPSLTLTPGNNTYPIESTTNQTQVALLLQQDEYHCGVLPVDIRGNRSVADGKVLSYYSKALQAVPVRTDFNITPTLEEAGLGAAVGGPDSCKSSS
ncbi:hypothetical protein D0863_09985 [Hortaea werneckii]|uniref:Uncharacterized protein n=1 Tax=Hortaea werneckii TaxID=91943 RepID=A0A3M7DIM7_HORWE|nr:hypothetical protein D0863_09985 [Hortaea werneckii]